MRGVGHEMPLRRERCLQPAQQAIERVGEFFELIVRAVQGEPLVQAGGGDAPRGRQWCCRAPEERGRRVRLHARRGQVRRARRRQVRRERCARESGPGGGTNAQASLPTPALSPAQNQAQIAAAVTDTNCTLSTDLGGIYFAIQTSYEQQFITANQQALNASVREYKANFAKELSQLPALLRATSATLPTAPSNRR